MSRDDNSGTPRYISSLIMAVSVVSDYNSRGPGSISGYILDFFFENIMESNLHREDSWVAT